MKTPDPPSKKFPVPLTPGHMTIPRKTHYSPVCKIMEYHSAFECERPNIRSFRLDDKYTNNIQTSAYVHTNLFR